MIAEHFHSVSLEQVYATTLYYLRNREQLDAYLADWLAFRRTAHEQQERNLPLVIAPSAPTQGGTAANRVNVDGTPLSAGRTCRSLGTG